MGAERKREEKTEGIRNELSEKDKRSHPKRQTTKRRCQKRPKHESGHCTENSDKATKIFWSCYKNERRQITNYSSLWTSPRSKKKRSSKEEMGGQLKGGLRGNGSDNGRGIQTSCLRP